MPDVIPLPGITETIYSQFEANGVIVIIVAAAISLIAVIGLLIALTVAAFRPKFNTTADYLFLQSNFGLYFISLLIANIIASTGSIMNARWVGNKAVISGGFCTAQGAIKNIGNVATALWTLVIAIHVFNLLFLRHETKRIAGVFTTIGIWCSVCTLDIFGPAVLEKRNIGPYFGVAGLWCWITEDYPGARVGLEYFWFFFSGAMSFVLYMLVFLRLRGNFVFAEGSRLPKFIWVPRAKAWKLQANRDAVDAHMTDVAKQMIWFPVAYTIVIIPITFGRFLSNAGSTMTFEWYIFADAFFMSSGLINVILFVSTRKALPKGGVLPTFNIPRKAPPAVFIPPPSLKNGDIVAFDVSSAASDKSFGTHDRNSRKYDNAVEDEKVIVTNLGGTFRGHQRIGSGNAVPSSPRATGIRPRSYEARPDAAPSPPVDRHQRDSRPNSMDSISAGRNPFSDDQAPSQHEREHEYDGYGGRRGEWEPSLSAYFEVDLATPRPDRTHFSFGAPGGGDIPSTRTTNTSTNRI